MPAGSTEITVINYSTVLADNEIEAVLPALQQQVTEHFRPAWGIDAELKFVPKSQTPPSGSWWLSIVDDSDQAGVLGVHDLTPEGLPLGKVFAATDLKYGSEWTVTASHELLEMLADPNINLSVFVQESSAAGRLYAYEVCDACEDDRFGYKIDGVLVSDFVFPSWFESFRDPSATQFDQQDQIKKPFELLAGGYIGIFDVTAGFGWTQLTARQSTVRARGKVGSRRERRKTPRTQWLHSQPVQNVAKNAQFYRERLSRLAHAA